MGKKAVASGALWACSECGVVFVDLKGRVRTRIKPPEEETVYYLRGHCPNCDRNRVEVIDVVSAEASQRISAGRNLNYKESPVVDSSSGD